MNKKIGRPRKQPDNLRVTKGFSISQDNLQFIQNLSKAQEKNTSEILNTIIETIRKLTVA